MRVRTSSLAALAALTLSALSACGGGSSGGAAEPRQSPSASPKLCPLTGQQPTGGQDPSRVAVAMKVDNVDVARPQAGLDPAGVLFEGTLQGGPTPAVS